MTVGEFCRYLNPDDLIILTKPDGSFASGYVTDMSEYFDETVLHISADIYSRAFKKNKNVGYEIEIA